jgi:hypothetical protein
MFSTPVPELDVYVKELVKVYPFFDTSKIRRDFGTSKYFIKKF